MHLPGFDLIEIVKTVGYVGVFGIIFAESGLFFGFFFPGDSLLFTSGFLASQNLPGLTVIQSYYTDLFRKIVGSV